MFTGIVEGQATVEAIVPRGQAHRLCLELGPLAAPCYDGGAAAVAPDGRIAFTIRTGIGWTTGPAVRRRGAGRVVTYQLDGGAYRVADSPLRWLYRVADNCCFDALKRRRDRPPPLPLAEDLEPGTHPDVDERLRVARALDHLPDRERQVAVRAFVDGLTQDQIATEIGWSRQTINRKLKEIRDRLGRWLHVN